MFPIKDKILRMHELIEQMKKAESRVMGTSLEGERRKLDWEIMEDTSGVITDSTTIFIPELLAIGVVAHAGITFSWESDDSGSAYHDFEYITFGRFVELGAD